MRNKDIIADISEKSTEKTGVKEEIYKNRSSRRQFVRSLSVLLSVALFVGSLLNSCVKLSDNPVKDTSGVGLNISEVDTADTSGEMSENPPESEGFLWSEMSFEQIIDSVPDFDGETPYTVINGNVPFFSESELLSCEAFEIYSELDPLGRCGVAYANICKELMPTEKRESISSVKPTGWVQANYSFITGSSLYNRCHLIAFQLAGENANEKNLITGTTYMNHDGMIAFENMVADFVKETNGHVLYRVTPLFKGSELVAHGVLMEAYSVEDKGESVCYCVYCYNVQPGVSIDYATGASRAATFDDTPDSESVSSEIREYVINTKNKKFHYPDCLSAGEISESNKKSFVCSRDELIEKGYSPCGRCKP